MLTLKTFGQRFPMFPNQAPSVHEVKGEADFHNQVRNAGNKLVLVDFYATWCSPCKYIAPFLEKFAKEFPSQMLVLKVDVDKNDALSRKYNVARYPTFFFLKNGRIIQQLNGSDPDKIRNVIVTLIK